MTLDPPVRPSSADASMLRRLDSVCDEFETEWHRGVPPSLPEFLERVPADERSVLLAELLPLDVAYRRQRGEECSVPDYCRILPAFQTQLVQLLHVAPANGMGEAVGQDDTTHSPDTEPAVKEAIIPETARSFGDYDLLEEIGRGGMGVVYRARQRSLDRIVALKTILAGPQAQPISIERFVSEARLAATLHHPGIVPIYEIGQVVGQHYFSMEFVAGRTLSQFVEQTRPSPIRIAELVVEVATAVHFAHERGVLHRDLKPSNVIVGEDNRVRVMDFGLAKRMEDGSPKTRAGELLGTPSYMPPEQARGDWANVDRRSDVYSLGALLYALLTTRPPHEADSPIETILKVIQDQPTPPRAIRPDLDASLEHICLKSLAKDRANRYDTVEQFANALNEYVRNPKANLFGWKRWLSRVSPTQIIMGVMATLMLVAGVIVVVLRDPDFPPREVVAPETNVATPAPGEASPKPEQASTAPQSVVLPDPRTKPKLPVPQAPRAGLLDTQFGENGVVTLSLGSASGVNDAYAVAVQSDGKIITAGQSSRTRRSYYVSLARFNPDGTLDRSFNSTGKMLLWFGPFDDGIRGRCLLIQPDGKILFGGRAEVRSNGYDFGLARIHPDGQLDDSFGREGLTTANVSDVNTSDLQALGLQPDGKIIAAGNTVLDGDKVGFVVARFHPNGSLDRAFGNNGRTTLDFPGNLEEITSVAVAPSGRIVAAGRAEQKGHSAVTVFCLQANGKLDPSFNARGHVQYDLCKDNESANMMVLQEERIVIQVSGEVHSLVRLEADGSIDKSFGKQGDGRVRFDYTCVGFAAMPDGNLLAVGPHQGRLTRLSKDGESLAEYGDSADDEIPQQLVFRDLTIAPDGSVVLAGTFRLDQENFNWLVARILGPKD